MSKHTITITITAAQKRDLTSIIEERIADLVGDELNTYGLKAVEKASQAASKDLYEAFLARTLKTVAVDVDLVDASYDGSYDWNPITKAAAKIARAPGLIEAAEKEGRATMLKDAKSAALKVGMRLVPYED